MNITEIYNQLPLSERTLLKRISKNAYNFKLLNDTGLACLYRVLIAGKEIGAVQYASGRKLCCHGIA